MSERSTQHATPTVQVNEVVWPEPAAMGKVLAVAGLAGAAISTVIAKMTEREEVVPPTRTESARTYLQSALEGARQKELGKSSHKRKKNASKKKMPDKNKATKNAEIMMEEARMRANQSAAAARGEFSSFLNTLKGGGMELERLADEFAESTLMNKLREFGEEARVMAEQGKLRSTEAAHKAQSDLIPQVKDAARQVREAGMDRATVVADKAKSDLIPAAQHLKDDLAEKAKTEFIPAAQKATTDVKVHAKDVVGTVSQDAEKLLSEATHTAAEKSKQAGTAVQRGGRETRSLLMWLGLAGILIFSVFLDEDQQKKFKEIAMEVFGEARDMYSDMKGDQQGS